MTGLMNWLRKKKWLFIELLLIVVVIVAVRGYQQRNVIKGPAPEISGQLLNGKLINWQQYHGKTLLVHFWASWCPICKLEQDSINSLANDYPVLSIASWSGSEDDVRLYLQEHQLDFPVLVDESGEWARHYGVSGVPASFLVDASGMIQFVEIGYTSETGFRLRLWWLGI